MTKKRYILGLTILLGVVSAVLVLNTYQPRDKKDYAHAYNVKGNTDSGDVTIDQR